MSEKETMSDASDTKQTDPNDLTNFENAKGFAQQLKDSAAAQPAPNYFNDAEKNWFEKCFSYRHLQPELQAVSAPFCSTAEFVVAVLPPNNERTVALRKLLEAKDAAVRAKLL